MARMPVSSLGVAFVSLLLIFFSSSTRAADLNNYTAQYECRAGGPQCNVDVEQYASRACDHTVQEGGTSWPAINWNNDANGDGHVVICIAAGDHVGKGTLTIPADANGTDSNYKVLRYTRSGDNNDDPWNQSDAHKAKVKGLYIRGHYWLVQRLTFPGTLDGPTPRLESSNGATNHIFNRILVEGTTQAGVSYYGYSQACGTPGYDRLTVQNSVFRNLGPAGPEIESIAIDLQCGTNMHAVNNEVYNWVSHAVQVGSNFPNPILPGLVVENNDFYVTPDLYTNGGATAKTEGPLSIKFHGTEDSPGLIIQNRLWGARTADRAFCCNGEGGQLITNYEVLSHVLFQNNILFDAQTGLGNIGTRQSVVGNIFWNMKKHWSDEPSSAIGKWKFDDAPDQSLWEIYLNTIIGADGEWSVNGLDSADADTKCNVLIASGPKYPVGVPSSSHADYNVFYGSPSFTDNGTNTNVDLLLNTRANNTTYQTGTVIRTTSAPPGNGTAGDFLYRVITAGQSAASPPAYCTALGCTTQDGTMVVSAIRGPYAFYRKLKTGPEQIFIPYARVHADADEASFCPGFGQANALGSRTAVGSQGEVVPIGVNNDIAWSGLFAVDLKGASRTGTAGALQSEGSGGGGGGGGSGTILREYWTGVGGAAVSDLTSHPNYPNNPTGSDQPTLFEAPTDWADNYGTRIHGFVHPPASGNYVFWIAADDDAELWLSTDANPANKVRIAFINGWTASREWDKFASQQSAPITLTAGQRYYIEALQKEGVGGDNLAVGWQLPNGTFEGPIPGTRLSGP